jgi:hypothetical protein
MMWEESGAGAQDLVFMISADAGSVQRANEAEDGGGGGTFVDEVAGEDEVVVGRLEGNVFEECMNWRMWY